MRFLILCLVATWLKLDVQAQYFSSGSDPWRIQWKQIRTPHVQVVFSSDMESSARKVAAMIDTLHLTGGYSLGHAPRRIPLVLHSKSAYSNGFVSWAPMRSEWYTTPPQDVDVVNWLEQLAIHEYRHVVQIDKLNTGFTRGLSWLLGQQGVGAVLGLYVPFWLVEGDAVLSETLLTDAGRGRMPEFEQALRAQWLQLGIYSLNKAYLGSYRDEVPNYYHLGYALVTGARSRYGADLWENALNRIGKRSWSLVPLQWALKQETGMGKRALYQSVAGEWQQKWTLQDSLTPKTPLQPLVLDGVPYDQYFYVQPLESGNLIAELNGPGRVNSLVEIDLKHNRTQILTLTGNRGSDPVSANGHFIMWSEQEPHWRWENEVYSNVWLYNRATRSKRRLTTKGRYFSPALSPVDSQWVAVHLTEQNECFLQFFDLTGKALHNVSVPESTLALTPCWSSDGRDVVVVLQDAQGKRLARYDVEHRNWYNISAPSFTQIRLPRVFGNKVYYTSSETGIENIFFMPLRDVGSPVQLTSARFGAACGIPASDSVLWFSNYTAQGYQLAKAPLRAVQIPNSGYSPMREVLQKPLLEELPAAKLPELKGEAYEVRPYSKWNLFHFHSWAPLYMNVSDVLVRPGVSALSQNLLGTAVTQFGFNADPQMSREKFYFNFLYKAWIPAFDFTVSHGDDKVNFAGLAAIPPDTFYVKASDKVMQTRVRGLVRIPVYFAQGKWSRYLEPYAGAEFLNQNGYAVSFTPVTRTPQGWVPKGEGYFRRYEDLNYTDLQYGIFFYNLHRTARRDVGSRWGQVVEMRYRHTPWGENSVGWLWGISGRLFFPGIGRHHQIRVDGGFQQKGPGDVHGVTAGGYEARYSYGDFLAFPRGYARMMNNRMSSWKINYKFPLLNPDWSVGSLVYVKRITCNAFYDYAQGNYELVRASDQTRLNRTFELNSLGGELLSETHLLQFLIPFQIGYRYAWLREERAHTHEFLLQINFSGFLVNREVR